MTKILAKGKRGGVGGGGDHNESKMDSSINLLPQEEQQKVATTPMIVSHIAEMFRPMTSLQTVTKKSEEKKNKTNKQTNKL